MEKFTKVIGNETYDLFTEIRPGTDCLCVIMEKHGEGNFRKSYPVRSYSTPEKRAEEMIKEMESSNAHYAWAKEIKAIPMAERVNHPQFAYFRRKQYGVAMYFKSRWSPTGVENMGGFSEEEFAELGLGKHGVAQRNDF